MAADLRNSRVTAPRDFTPKHPLAGKKLSSSRAVTRTSRAVLRKSAVSSEFLLGPKHSPKARSKKVSPKSRRTAELYKSSHNIGNRTAAGWVGSYKESEYALVYPEGFWESVKPENGEVSPDHSPVRDKEKEKDSKHGKDKLKEKDSKEKPSSPCRTGTKRKHSESDTLNKADKTKVKSEKTKSDRSNRTKSKSPQRPKSKSPQRGSREAKSTSDNKKGSSDSKKEAKKTSKDKEKDDAKSAKKGNKSPRSPSPPKKASQKDKDSKTGSSSKKSKKPAPPPVRPRAPRIKRTACLNANAINSLLYENDEPSPKKHKVEEDEEVVPDDKISVFAFNSDDSQSSLPDLSRGRKWTKETKPRDGSKDSAKGGKKVAKKGGKEVKKEVKKKVSRQCQLVESSSEEESESESEKEDNTPLWPPPKRMASLNAQAIWTATQEPYRRIKTEKTPKALKKEKSDKPENEKPEKEEKVEKCEKKEKATKTEKTEKTDGAEKVAPKVSEKTEALTVVTSSGAVPATTCVPPSSASVAPATTTAVAVLGTPFPMMSTEQRRPDMSYMQGQSRCYPSSQMRHARPPSPDIQIISAHLARGGSRPFPFPPPSPDVQIIEVNSPPRQHAPPNVPQRVPPSFYPQHQSQMSQYHQYPMPHQQHHSHLQQRHGQMQSYPSYHGHHSNYQQHHYQDSSSNKMGMSPLGSPQSQMHGHGGPRSGEAQYGASSQHSVSPSHGQHPNQGSQIHSGQQQPQQQPQPPPQQQQQQHPQQQPQQQPHQQQTQQQGHQMSPGGSAMCSPNQNMAMQQSQMGMQQQSSGMPSPQGQMQQGHSQPQLQPQPRPHPALPPGPSPLPPAHCENLEDIDSLCLPNAGIMQRYSSDPQHSQGHSTSPMGNQCPYPFSHGGSVGQGVSSSQCQGIPPLAGMESMNAYHIMSSCHRRHRSAFSVPNFSQHQSFGYYQPGGPAMVQAMGDTCCVTPPFSYHVHQQQVKVLVHNPTLSIHTTLPSVKSTMQAHGDASFEKKANSITKNKIMSMDSGGDGHYGNSLRNANICCPSGGYKAESPLDLVIDMTRDGMSNLPPMTIQELSPSDHVSTRHVDWVANSNGKVTVHKEPPPTTQEIKALVSEVEAACENKVGKASKVNFEVNDSKLEGAADTKCDESKLESSIDAKPEVSISEAMSESKPDADTKTETKPETEAKPEAKSERPSSTKPDMSKCMAGKLSETKVEESMMAKVEEETKLTDLSTKSESVSAKPEPVPSIPPQCPTNKTSERSSVTKSNSSVQSKVVNVGPDSVTIERPAGQKPLKVTSNHAVCSSDKPDPFDFDLSERPSSTSCIDARGEHRWSKPTRPASASIERVAGAADAVVEKTVKPVHRPSELFAVDPFNKVKPSSQLVANGSPQVISCTNPERLQGSNSKDKHIMKGDGQTAATASSSKNTDKSSTTPPSTSSGKEPAPNSTASGTSRNRSAPGTHSGLPPFVPLNPVSRQAVAWTKPSSSSVTKEVKSKTDSSDKQSKNCLDRLEKDRGPSSVQSAPSGDVSSTATSSSISGHNPRDSSSSSGKDAPESVGRSLCRTTTRRVTADKVDKCVSAKPSSIASSRAGRLSVGRSTPLQPGKVTGAASFSTPAKVIGMASTSGAIDMSTKAGSPNKVSADKQPQQAMKRTIEKPSTLALNPSDGPPVKKTRSPTAESAKVKSPPKSVSVDRLKVPSPNTKSRVPGLEGKQRSFSAEAKVRSPVGGGSRSASSSPSKTPKTSKMAPCRSPTVKNGKRERISPEKSTTSKSKAAEKVDIKTKKSSPILKIPGPLKVDVKQKDESKLKVTDGTKTPKKEDGKSVRSSRSPTLPRRMWQWEGEGQIKPIYQGPDVPLADRKCYQAVRHIDGDVVKVRDCVLVRSGPRKTDVPYVAKIAALWEHPETYDMMMSVMWYYRPEHTETEKLPQSISCEIFASKHRDETGVACIDDTCYVLTLNEYNRYRSHQKHSQEGLPKMRPLVPPLEPEECLRQSSLPSIDANPETVFLCRRVYDFKLKRVLKNPTPS